MTELPANLEIRRVAPHRRWLILAAAGIAGAAALYLAYDRGRYDAGYDRVAVAEQRDALKASIAKLEKADRDLSARVAELDTLRVGRAQERAELAHTIGELQAQVSRQEQEISFYRSVLSASTAPHGEGLELRQVRITSAAAPGRYDVHLTLLDRTRPEAESKGTLQLSVEGTQGGKPATLGNAILTGGKAAQQAFAFRYFDTVDEQIALPQGFEPQRLTIEAHAAGIRPAKHDSAAAAPLVQSFPWRVEAP